MKITQIALLSTLLLLNGCASQPATLPVKQFNLEEFQSQLSEEAKNLKVVSFGEPYFPAKAALNGKEGWCVSMFDVNKQGVPENINIVFCSLENYFEKACEISSSRLRYEKQSKIIEGAMHVCRYKLQ